MKHSPIVTFLKGLIVGGTMLVPGVSGGSMAIVLGIYDKLIHAVSALTRLDKASFIFLCAFSAGGGLGIIAFAKPLLHFMETYPIPTSYFFLGAVAGSVPITFRQGNISSLSAKAVLYILLGVVIVALFAAAPIDGLHAQTDGGLFFLILWIVTGFVASIALILPGISVSYLLYLLGVYDQILLAISSLSFSLLIPLGGGVIAGIVATTKLLEKAMNAGKGHEPLSPGDVSHHLRLRPRLHVGAVPRRPDGSALPRVRRRSPGGRLRCHLHSFKTGAFLKPL